MIGQSLLHYRITAKLGEGGMGAVYAAEDSKLGRRVAIKVLPGEFAGDPERLARFQREARAVAGLNHPNIVVLHSVEEAEGVHFLTMELVEGEPLSRLIPQDGMPIDQLLEIGTALADAVATAHDRGITHRDLKPANIMVTPEGRVKVLDFGLAKLADPMPEDVHTQVSTELLTEEGRVLGTPAYMSPEQLAGDVLDARSDVFSCGVVLYEMSTGRRPFVGKTKASTMTAILQETPPSPSAVRALVPPPLDAIIERSIEKAPGDRFQSMGELRDALLGVAPGGARSESGLWRRLAVIGGAALAVAAVLLWPDGGDEPQEAESGPSEAGSAEVRTDTSRGPSIAVLPFTNASGDPEQDYFSNGLTEELITELSRFSELAVVARTSTLEYTGPSLDLRTAGDELGVRYILQGSVQKAGDNIRVSAQLADTIEGTQLWGESYTRALGASEFFELQDEVTQEVVSAIAGSYGALFRAELAQARRKPPSTLDSYDCVLRGYDYLQIHSEANHLLARDCLETAVLADPEYSDAKAWLAYIYSEEYHHRWNENPGSLERALELVEEAVRLDTANQAAHGALSLTLFNLGDHDRALIEARRTAELNPGNALWLAVVGLYAAQVGDLEWGMEQMARAITLSPHPPSWFSMAFFYDHYLNGRYEEALAEGLRMDWSDDFRLPMFVAAAYGQLGRREDAAAAIEAMLQAMSFPVQELRQELIERHVFSEELTDSLIEGLVKSGLEFEGS